MMTKEELQRELLLLRAKLEEMRTRSSPKFSRVIENLLLLLEQFAAGLRGVP